MSDPYPAAGPAPGRKTLTLTREQVLAAALVSAWEFVAGAAADPDMVARHLAVTAVEPRIAAAGERLVSLLPSTVTLTVHPDR